MPKKLFLLDGMALVYRAHFALIQRPIFTSQGVNTSALYGFSQTLLDILTTREPTHVAVAFDTAVPTQRHIAYPEYKAQREAMPEELSQALPHVRRLIQAFRIPVLTCDGYEADDIIGTLVRRAEPEGFLTYMVTPDKDFGQLVTASTLLYRPGRMGSEVEILGPEAVCARWGIARPEQVIDLLGLAGDTSDNIPGVPGIGEKTAAKLIAQYGSLENVLARADQLKGRLRDNLLAHCEQARLSRRLATIDCAVPLEVRLEDLALADRDDDALRRLLVEFEFHSIGRRLYGEAYRSLSPSGRGGAPALRETEPVPQSDASGPSRGEQILASGGSAKNGRSDSLPGSTVGPRTAPVVSITRDARRGDRLAGTPAERRELLSVLNEVPSFALAVRAAGGVGRGASLLGLAFAISPGTGWYVPLPPRPVEAGAVLREFQPLWTKANCEIVGHDLKLDLLTLLGYEVRPAGRLFDVALAHALIEPDQRHALGYLAETFLGCAPLSAPAGSAAQGELALDGSPAAQIDLATIERADLAFRLRAVLEPRLAAVSQERVFRELEMPLVPVLAAMEAEGIRVDAPALAEFSRQLSQRMAEEERAIHALAGGEFNVNSPRQLGEVLFDRLRLADAPKKTRTGQYATDEATLQSLAEHEIVRRLLDYRAAAKLRSTYADALPQAIDPRTGRVHTTYQQLATSTGRLNSQNPNLQNIPIRTGLGQEIRKAFVPRDADHELLSADYSQIELRILAALSGETTLLEALRRGVDVHTVTAARVFGVASDAVTGEMRKQAKMVNYGIAYGISAFGLAQRLAIPRQQAAAIIDHYFTQFPGIRNYTSQTVEFCRRHGYVETVLGRRRYLRDIASANGTIRAAAERNAINAPIQGTAADLIKIAMIRIQGELQRRGLRSRMLLQVHDELVFDLYIPERDEVRALVEQKMRTALPLDVPIVVELGTGRNWLEAH